MRELWLMAKREYLVRVQQRSFFLGTMAIPLLIVVSVGVAILVSMGGQDSRPLGYVDESGVLAPGVIPAPVEGEEALSVRAFGDASAARAALENGEIQAYYVLSPDYLRTREVALYYLEQGPSRALQERFGQFIRANLLVGQPVVERSWMLEGPTLTVLSADGTRDWSQSNQANIILPIVMSFFFFFVVMGSSGFMLEVVSDEKENRTIEVIATSMTPEQIMGGKALGLMAVALTQLAIWVAVAVGGLLVAAQFVPFLSNLQVPWGLALLALLYFLPSFALVCGIMTAIGAAVGELRQGQQIAGVVNMLFVLPMLLAALVFINPNYVVLVVLTLFPTTAMITLLLRWGVTVVPLWQVVISWVLLTVSATLSVWMAARIFRLGMLRYGQGLNLREALAGLRGRKVR